MSNGTVGGEDTTMPPSFQGMNDVLRTTAFQAKPRGDNGEEERFQEAQRQEERRKQNSLRWKSWHALNKDEYNARRRRAARMKSLQKREEVGKQKRVANGKKSVSAASAKVTAEQVVGPRNQVCIEPAPEVAAMVTHPQVLHTPSSMMMSQPSSSSLFGSVVGGYVPSFFPLLPPLPPMMPSGLYPGAAPVNASLSVVSSAWHPFPAPMQSPPQAPPPTSHLPMMSRFPAPQQPPLYFQSPYVNFKF